jgi:hypothetical protein
LQDIRQEARLKAAKYDQEFGGPNWSEGKSLGWKIVMIVMFLFRDV